MGWKLRLLCYVRSTYHILYLWLQTVQVLATLPGPGVSVQLMYSKHHLGIEPV